MISIFFPEKIRQFPITFMSTSGYTYDAQFPITFMSTCGYSYDASNDVLFRQ